MKMIIKKEELMELADFMWNKFDKKVIPIKISPMVGNQYGQAIARHSYSDGLGVATYALYKTHSDFYGDMYILVEDYENGERMYILPFDCGCIIEVED